MQQAAAQQAQAPAPGQQGQQPGPNYPMASLYVGDLAPEVTIITIITSIILDINISLLLIIIIISSLLSSSIWTTSNRRCSKFPYHALASFTWSHLRAPRTQILCNSIQNYPNHQYQGGACHKDWEEWWRNKQRTLVSTRSISQSNWLVVFFLPKLCLISKAFKVETFICEVPIIWFNNTSWSIFELHIIHNPLFKYQRW